MKTVWTGVCLLAGVLLLTGPAAPAGDKKGPRYTISEVMKLAQVSGLAKKVTTGKGDRADAERLLELYTELAKNKPPDGTPESWKQKTDALITAAKAAVAGDERANALLKKSAMSCTECHKLHKGR